MKSKNKVSRIKRPSFFMHISEAFRALKEYQRSKEFYNAFKKHNKGDGHPVLVIPGFLGSNTSTKGLRKFIKRLGYIPYDWGLGRNMADLSKLDDLLKLIDEVHEKHKTKISLIGWSLGGVYARELAKLREDKIRQVITLGSPFAGITEPNNAAWFYQLLKGKSVEDIDPAWLESLPIPAPVPTTAVYSKEDGVVSWKVCREIVEDKFHQNVEVTGSHMGLANNASVWFLIEDRLQYKKETWNSFNYNGKMDDFVSFPQLETAK